MRMRGPLGVAGLLLVLMGGTAQADTINVSKTGADGAACGPAASPCQTINYAVEQRANDGDTVSITPDATSYDEGPIVTSESVSIVGAADGVVIGGDTNSATMTLNMTASQPVSLSRLTFRSRADQHVDEVRAAGPVNISDLTFDSPHPITDGAQLSASGSGDGQPSVNRVTFSGSGSSSSFNDAGRALVVRGSSPSARATVADITVGAGYVSTFAEIVGLQNVDATRLHGFARAFGTFNVTGTTNVSDSTVVNDLGSGAAFRVMSELQDTSSGPVDVTIENSTLGGATAVATRSSAGSGARELTLRDNVLVGDVVNLGSIDIASTHDTIDGEARLQNGGTLHLVNSYLRELEDFSSSINNCTSEGSAGLRCGMTPAPAPGFVNAAAGDYRLTASSPLIDVGVAISGDNRALDGNADGVVTSDAGVDEYAPVPDTTIISGPGATEAGQAAMFAFGSAYGGATFTCSLDGAAPTACASPFTSGPLAAGDHTFSVVATVGAKPDPTPATSAFTLVTPTQPGTGGGGGAGGTGGTGGTPGTGSTGSTGGAGGAGGTGGTGTTPPAAKAPKVTKLKLTRLSVTFTASGPGTVTAKLVQVLARGKTKRVGNAVRVTVKKQGKVTIKRTRFAKKLKKGRYRVQITSGRTTVKSSILRIR